MLKGTPLRSGRVTHIKRFFSKIVNVNYYFLVLFIVGSFYNIPNCLSKTKVISVSLEWHCQKIHADYWSVRCAVPINTRLRLPQLGICRVFKGTVVPWCADRYKLPVSWETPKCWLGGLTIIIRSWKKRKEATFRTSYYTE